MSTRDDVEEFAALLRQLKARTDRSYGSLARRLNMNTSTLHRYCAGEAVPTDFAPVERFAAFCDATPEERHELHRLWLLAVAARQRPRAAEAASAEDTEVIANAEGGLPGPDSAPASGHPWYRRRRILVGAAAASVLMLTLGSLSALSDDRPPSRSAQSPDRAGTTEAGTATRSATPSGSPSAGRSASSSPSSSSGKKSSASPTPKKEGPAGKGTSGPASGGGGTPLTWTADDQIWEGTCGHDYVIDKPITEVPPPPAQQDAGVWAATQGAVHGRLTKVQITVQGRSSTAVVLEGLRVRVVGRAAPIAGIDYAMDQGCGGGLTPRYFAVNLDKDRPVARAQAGNDTGSPIPAVKFPYKVSAQDPEVLLVDATTATCDCSWYLELEWSSEGRTGTVRIDDHGSPFRTTSAKGLPRYWYGTNDAGARAWVPTERY
ncbi:helix-turn-helix domain-containing protein [Streptomyces sp. NPDC088794]|uniref:helix-turn-helix domain-containing protein n=1 Tax=Streptomyces sp. NPDC088794 TaxID=3365902 RepID=UPI003826EA5C